MPRMNIRIRLGVLKANQFVRFFLKGSRFEKDGYPFFISPYDEENSSSSNKYNCNASESLLRESTGNRIILSLEIVSLMTSRLA